MAIWQYWKSLSPRTRLMVGGGVIVYAVTMEYLSNLAERKLNLVPTEEDYRKLENAVPKIRAIERKEGPGGER